MRIQDLGSLGEVIAAVATVATLIYLARQLDANTSAVRAESRRANRAASGASNLLIASDAEIAAMYRAGLKDFSALSPDQHTQFSFLLGEQIAAWEIAYEEFEEGLVDLTYVDNMAPGYIPLLSTPGGRQWWAAYCKGYSPSFQAYFNTQIENGDKQRHTAREEAAAQQSAAADSAQT